MSPHIDQPTWHAPVLSPPTAPGVPLCGRALPVFGSDVVAKTVDAYVAEVMGGEVACWECDSILDT